MAAAAAFWKALANFKGSPRLSLFALSAKEVCYCSLQFCTQAALSRVA